MGFVVGKAALEHDFYVAFPLSAVFHMNSSIINAV
jgi:hypothetical protein